MHLLKKHSLTVVSLLLVMLSAAVYLIFTSSSTNTELSVDDSANYVNSYEDILGLSWSSGTVRRSNEDEVGWLRSIVNSSTLRTYYSQNELVYIDHTVTIYRNEIAARNRFQQIKSRVFVYNYGVPPTQQQNSYEMIETDETNSEFGCLRALAYIRCNAVLLIDNRIEFLDVMIERDGVVYLTVNEFLDLAAPIEETD